MSLISDIQNLNELFAKKKSEAVEKPILKKRKGRPRKTKAEKIKKMKTSLKALKTKLKK